MPNNLDRRLCRARQRNALYTAIMRIEVLCFDGCANREALLPHLRELLCALGVGDEIEVRRVEDDAAAQRERFLGSPTVRVDGDDVDPGARERDDFGLGCRLFATPDGLRGMPADEWIVAAVERARVGTERRG